MAGGATSIAKTENVLIRAGECAISVLPQFGAKIASILIGERELLQRPLRAVEPRTRTMSFDDGDAGGWDECLPSVAACRIQVAGRDAEIPDHGDLWRVEWEKIEDHGREAGPSSLRLRGRCFSLPLELERDLELSETSGGWQLDLKYRLTNAGLDPLPWSWSAHPLFTVERGDRIVLPGSIHTLRLEGSGQDRLGAAGDQVEWPLATLGDGATTDLSLAQSPRSGIGDKLFAGPLGAEESWCALERPQAGLRIQVKFDSGTLPYLGLWICYGGWPEKPGPKQVAVALEPATAPVDSLAVEGPWSRSISPGESCSWSMSVEIERIEMTNA